MQTAGGHEDAEGSASEGSEGSGEPITGNRGKETLFPQGQKLSKVMNLDISLSTFLSPPLQLRPDGFLLQLIKWPRGERKEMKREPGLASGNTQSSQMAKDAIKLE